MWTPTRWKHFPTQMQPCYLDANSADQVLHHLQNAPQLVSKEDILQLRNQLALCEKGDAFILQAGDCAEPFADCTEHIVLQKTNFILELAHILQNALHKKVIPIGRMAGQYAKPRSEQMEISNGKQLLNYAGDIINGFEFDEKTRAHDPQRLLQAYDCSQKTLAWIDGKIFTSHEALHLGYESALTRTCPPLADTSSKLPSNLLMYRKYTRRFALVFPRLNQRRTRFASLSSALSPLGAAAGSSHFCFSAHMLWLGERTKRIDGAHVEFLRGIENPIGIKIGPSTKEDNLVSLIKILNPKNESGKINLITRMGCHRVEEILPSLIRAVQKSNIPVSWSADPMHANTQKTPHGFKTRYFLDILNELKLTHKIHKNENSFLSGIHIETSPFDVTECIGGMKCVHEIDLEKNYKTLCDPRLNRQQSLELVNLFCNDF